MIRALQIIAIVTIGCIIAVGIFKLLFPSTAVAQAKAGNLSRELALIKPPQHARRLNHEQFYKAGYASAQDTYVTALNWASLQQHYDSQFRQQSWRPHATQHLREWGADRGGIMRTYCRDDMLARLQYDGSGRPGWTYAVSIEWDGTQCPP